MTSQELGQLPKGLQPIRKRVIEERVTRTRTVPEDYGYFPLSGGEIRGEGSPRPTDLYPRIPKRIVGLDDEVSRQDTDGQMNEQAVDALVKDIVAEIMKIPPR